jgi:ribosomal protein S2
MQPYSGNGRKTSYEEALVTTYKSAEKVLREAVKDPKNKEKLAAAKKHPKLKKLLAGVTQDDVAALNKIARGGGIVKCTS